QYTFPFSVPITDQLNGRKVIAVALTGTLAYVVQTRPLVVPPGTIPYSYTYCWIDTYDITDPAHPTWLDSVESAVNFDFGQLYIYNGLLYQVSVSATQIALYDIGTGRPV